MQQGKRWKKKKRHRRLATLCRYNPATMAAVSFRIRQFEKADFDTLWRIDQDCFDPQLAYSRPEMAFYIRRPASFTLVAERDGGGGEVPGHGSARAGVLIPGFILADTRPQTGPLIPHD